MQFRLVLIFALLVNASARADDVEGSIAAADMDGRFERALQVRVGDVLDRSAELAEERALAGLEARAAGSENEVTRSLAARVERQLVASTSGLGGAGREDVAIARVRTESWLVGALGPRPPGEAALAAPALDPAQGGAAPPWSAAPLTYR